MVVGGKILPQFNGIGQNGGFLGPNYAPFFLDESAAFRPPEDVPPLRLDHRRQMLSELDRTARWLDRRESAYGFSVLQDRAFGMLSSSEFKSAFDLDREPERVRDAYGRFPLGQNLLLARRLVEAGVPVVQVSDIPPKGEQHWDLHYANIFQRLKNTLLPCLDQAVCAFLEDLHDRGLLEETLVVIGGEFGRPPWMDTSVGQGGKQHWPHCYSLQLAGAGIHNGLVYGASDRTGAYPTTDRVAPWDIAATVFHLAGIDPEVASIRDPRQGRLRPICEGKLVEGLLI
jgi:hypothetical protein